MKKLAEKVFSRKLAAFLVSTIALWLGVINQEAWEAVALAYLGAQGLVDVVSLGVDKLKDKAEGTAFEATEAKPAAKKPAAKKAPAKKPAAK